MEGILWDRLDGGDIRLFTGEAAREWLEEKRFTEALEREFGNEIVDG